MNPEEATPGVVLKAIKDGLSTERRITTVEVRQEQNTQHIGQISELVRKHVETCNDDKSKESAWKSSISEKIVENATNSKWLMWIVSIGITAISGLLFALWYDLRHPEEMVNLITKTIGGMV